MDLEQTSSAKGTRNALVLGLALLAPGLRAFRIACVGNSVTFGYGLSWPQRQSYPYLLDSLRPAADSVGNFGNSGKTMIHWVGDSYWKTPEFSAALAFAPDQVVIELGTNDGKSYIWPAYDTAFRPDYRAMIDTFRHLRSAPRVLVNLLPPANNPSWSILDTTIVRRVNPYILQVALEKGADVLDLHPLFANWSLFQSDSVHPNQAGALVLAQAVQSILGRIPFQVAVSGRTFTAPSGAAWQWYRNDTLLAGATARTLTVSDSARYKVSVQFSSESQSRVVSDAVRAVPAGVRSAARRSGIVVYGRRGRLLHMDVQGGEAFLFLVDPSGRARRTRVEPGVSEIPVERAGLWAYQLVRGGADLARGTFVVLP